MLRYLKLIFSLGIFVCMFLPLSQCSNPWSSPKNNSQSVTTNESVVEKTVAIATILTTVVVNKPPTNFPEFIIFVTFIVPLLFCVPYARNKRLYFAHLLMQTVFIGWLLLFIFVLVYSVYEPLYGGYILTFFSGAFLINTLFEWFVFIRIIKSPSYFAGPHTDYKT